MDISSALAASLLEENDSDPKLPTPPSQPTFPLGIHRIISSSHSDTADTVACSQPSSSNKLPHGFSDCTDVCDLPNPAQFGDQVSFICTATACLNTGRPVAALAVSGDVVYSGLEDSSIGVWQRSGLRRLSASSRSAGDGMVKCLAVAGNKLFSGHQDRKVRVWQIAKSQVPGDKLVACGTLPTCKNYLSSIFWPKNADRKCFGQLYANSWGWIKHSDSVSALAAGQNGLLYSGSWDSSIKVWEISSLKCVESFKGHDDAVNAVVVSSSGFLYTGSADTKVKVWERSSTKHMQMQLASVLEGHASSVNALALSHDERILYSASSDGRIVAWERGNIETVHMCQMGTLTGHAHAVLSLAISAANLLCSGSTDKTIRLWQRNSSVQNMHSCVAILRGHKAPVKALAADNSQQTADAWFLYSGSLDGEIKEWRLSRSEQGSSSQAKLTEENS